jgi:hypothetical protein
MRNINSEAREVEEVNEVKEVEDSESRDLNPRGVRMLAGEDSRSFDFHRARMVGGGLGFSFTSYTSFTSFTSLAFTGVYS